jgi:GDP-mannose 6-dehydrogenase
MKVAIFGLGYVGTVTAAGLASRGHEVVGVDVELAKVNAIRQGRSPVVEPDLEPLIAACVKASTLRVTTSPEEAVEGADVSLLCVGTPSASLGDTDLTYLSRALEDIRLAMSSVAPPASGFHSVVVRSTVPPGTVDGIVAPVFERGGLPAGWSVGTAMCPEFLREGSGLNDFFAPPFFVVGTGDDRVARALTELFGFTGAAVHHVDVRVAEALKYACNAFHATKVSFANEMGRIFRVFGVDSREVMRIFCEDSTLNISPTYLRPGFAFGGSCLPKDLRALQHMARMNGVDAPLLAGTSMSNELVVRGLLDRIIATQDRNVCLLGLSFKMNTDDLRESPNVDLAERLIGKGFNVSIYDPIVNPERLVGANKLHVEARLPHLNRLLHNSAEEALAGADMAVVASTDVKVLQALRDNPPRRIFDVSGRLGTQVEALKSYEGIGW